MYDYPHASESLGDSPSPLSTAAVKSSSARPDHKSTQHGATSSGVTSGKKKRSSGGADILPSVQLPRDSVAYAGDVPVLPTSSSSTVSGHLEDAGSWSAMPAMYQDPSSVTGNSSPRQKSDQPGQMAQVNKTASPKPPANAPLYQGLSATSQTPSEYQVKQTHKAVSPPSQQTTTAEPSLYQGLSSTSQPPNEYQPPHANVKHGPKKSSSAGQTTASSTSTLPLPPAAKNLIAPDSRVYQGLGIEAAAQELYEQLNDSEPPHGSNTKRSSSGTNPKLSSSAPAAALSASTSVYQGLAADVSPNETYEHLEERLSSSLNSQKSSSTLASKSGPSSVSSDPPPLYEDLDADGSPFKNYQSLDNSQDMDYEDAEDFPLQSASSSSGPLSTYQDLASSKTTSYDYQSLRASTKCSPTPKHRHTK